MMKIRKTSRLTAWGSAAIVALASFGFLLELAIFTERVKFERAHPAPQLLEVVVAAEAPRENDLAALENGAKDEENAALFLFSGVAGETNVTEPAEEIGEITEDAGESPEDKGPETEPQEEPHAAFFAG